MSSLASLFVAKANATPEKVVPWEESQVSLGYSFLARGLGTGVTYKVNADNELGLALARALDLGGVPVLLLGNGATSRRGSTRRVASSAAKASGSTHALVRVHVVRRRVSGVDGRRAAGHLAGRGAVLAVAERAGAATSGRGLLVLVGGRVARRGAVVGIHREAGSRGRGAA